MTFQQKLEIIQKFPLFEGVDYKQLHSLAEDAIEKNFSPQSIILSQDKIAENILLIYKGLIKIYIMTSEGKIVPIRTRGPMYIIGELNIIDSEKTATVETIQETCALALSIDECRRLLKTNAAFGYNLFKIVVEKLRAANQQAEYYFSSPLKERTWSILQAMSSHFPNKEIALSQEEIANIIGGTRARISEALNELENQKLIAISHRKIHVL